MPIRGHSPLTTIFGWVHQSKKDGTMRAGVSFQTSTIAIVLISALMVVGALIAFYVKTQP